MMTSIQQFALLIDGRLSAAGQGAMFDSVDPSTGRVFACLPDAGPADMDRAVRAARHAFDSGEWPLLTFSQREAYLKRMAEIIRVHARELAELESRDTGKTIKQTTFIDIPTAADAFDHFARTGPLMASRVNPVAAPVRSLTEREPVGVVGCIAPWNYPLIMLAWKTAPALIAGNTVVFKPSPEGCVSVMRLAELVGEAGLPPGVLNIVSSRQEETARELVRHPQVDMISFTGSTRTGQEVMKTAAETSKKLTLELGGKSPGVVFADCDREAALGGVMAAIFMNQGQMCTAASRLLLEEKIYDEFLEELARRTRALRIGPALDYQTQFGPVVSAEHRARLKAFVEKGLSEGARLVCGGEVPPEPALQQGCFFEPTIFADVAPEMALAREECFGPVLSVMRFSGERQAVAMANDTVYGLAACVWTKDPDKARRVARQCRCGTVWINTYGGFYHEAPFGGYKQSGFGRELGPEGLLEFTQAKHICEDQTPGGKPLAAAWF